MRNFFYCRYRGISASLLVASALAAPLSAQVTFSEPLDLTGSAEEFRLSRNQSQNIKFDDSDTLHLTYWTGGFFTATTSPSTIYYQQWTSGSGWSPSEVVDDSFQDLGSGPERVGGRHPALGVNGDGDVWITWHDSKDTNPNNGSLNTEIYIDERPAGGSFSSTDLRLTNTSANQFGDNGYTPRVAVADSGTVGVFWYDFHFDGNNSDVFVKYSDNSGSFTLTESMSDMRLTDSSTRGSFDAYSVPDVTVDSSGVFHAVWTVGFGGSAPLYYSALPNPAATVTESIIANDTGAFFDPPKITAAPNGDIWVVYTKVDSGEQSLEALRKPAASSTFDPAITLVDQASVAEEGIHAQIDTAGDLHLTWIDDRSGGSLVYYARYDTSADLLVDETVVTLTAGTYARPAIALDSSDRPHIVYEESVASGQGTIWFVGKIEPSSVTSWEMYQ